LFRSLQDKARLFLNTATSDSTSVTINLIPHFLLIAVPLYLIFRLGLFNFDDALGMMSGLDFSGYNAPSFGYGAPSPSYGAPAPASSYGAPAPAPAPSYGAPAPVPSYSAPPPSYEAPSYNAPAPSYKAPAPSYNAPAPSYNAPALSNNAPSNAYQAPSNGYVGPDDPGSNPIALPATSPRINNPLEGVYFRSKQDNDINLEYQNTQFPNVMRVQQQLEQLQRLRELLANGGGKMSLTPTNEFIAYPRMDVENTWNGLPGL